MIKHMYKRFKEFFIVGVFVITGLVYMGAYLIERATA